MLRFYNTLTRRKDELKPIHPDWVGLYTCGPTVYNFAHIGNLRTYIFEDILERTLRYNGHEVRRVMNITDVGHLTGDTDTGDDKLDREAHEQKKSVEEIAQFYTDAFFADLARLNIIKPDIIAPASKFINEQISVIETLIQNGFAYDTPTAVYFDVKKFPQYGKLSGQSLAEKTAAARVGAREEVVVDPEKHNAADFALWFKLTGKFKQHLLHWPSPWGEGFPGWHIECSAISRHFLGQPFDIHTGGVDHIGTHHENEIAQSESAFGVPLANIWMHGEHLLIDGGKMAKSEAEKFITLAELEKRGYHPLVYRYLVLGAHYRTQLNFTWESLDAARNGLERLYQAIYLATVDICMRNGKKKSEQEFWGDKDDPKKYEQKIESAIDDDLNIPKAIGILHDVLNSQNLHSEEKIELVEKYDAVFGLRLMDVKYEPEKEISIKEKFEEYKDARANKQFDKSDGLRKEIEKAKYEVRDAKESSYLVKKFF
jgi:cysteinyl-tRNA synthetase